MLSTKKLSFNTFPASRELQMLFLYSKEEFNSYIVQHLYYRMRENHSSTLEDALKTIQESNIFKSSNFRIWDLVGSFSWDVSGNENYYSGITSESYTEITTIRDLDHIPFELERKYVVKGEDYYYKLKSIETKKLKFLNSKGDKVTLQFERFSKINFWFPAVPISDEKSIYIYANETVYEIDLLPQDEIKIKCSEYVLSKVSSLGDGFLHKLSSIDKDNPNFLKFINFNNDENFSIEGFDKNGKLVKNLKFTRYISKFPEIFSNEDSELLAALLKNANTIELKIVEGEDIRYYYDSSNYLSSPDCDGSTLWGSCMRHADRHRMLDLYVNNPQVVKLLVGTIDGKTCCRALLWKTDQGITLMDRVYYIKESHLAFMIAQANTNGWYYKTKQSYDSKRNISFNGDVMPSMTLSVSPSLKGINHYPYMDTFTYLSYFHRNLCNTKRGAAYIELKDQYGTHPFSRAAAKYRDATPFIDSLSGEPYELGVHWKSHSSDKLVKTLGSETAFLNFCGNTPNDIVATTDALSYPYEDKNGFKSTEMLSLVADITQYQLKMLPTLNYLNLSGKIAYSDLKSKETYISYKDVIVYSDNLSPREVLDKLYEGKVEYVLTSFEEIITLANNFMVPDKLPLRVGSYLCLELYNKFSSVRESVWRESINPVNFITGSNLIALISLDPEIYIRYVSEEIDPSGFIRGYKDLLGVSEDTSDITAPSQTEYLDESIFDLATEETVTELPFQHVMFSDEGIASASSLQYYRLSPRNI